MHIKFTVLWDVVLCLVYRYQPFKRICCLHLHNTMEMDVTASFKVWLPVYRTIWCHIPKWCNLRKELLGCREKMAIKVSHFAILIYDLPKLIYKENGYTQLNVHTHLKVFIWNICSRTTYQCTSSQGQFELEGCLHFQARTSAVGMHSFCVN
jgi:hypothetical protein